MSLQSFMASDTDGVFIIGHSTALVRTAGILTLFDPVWGNFKLYGNDYWKFVPEQVDGSKLFEEISLVVVSHIHQDHFCAPVLKKLRDPAAVYIMDHRPKLWQQLDEVLHDSVDCFLQPPGKWVEVIDGVELYFVQHPYNDVDSSCFMRNKATGYTVYHGNDNFLDLGALQFVARDVKRVDVALLPYAFIHWWPFLQDMDPEKKQSEIARMNGECLKKAQDFIDLFKPTHAVPFGASVFYNNGAGHILNRSLVRPWHMTNAYEMLAGDWLMADGTGFRRPESQRQDAYEEMLKTVLGETSGYDLDLNFTPEPREDAPKPFFRRVQINGLEVTTTHTGQLHRFDFSREVYEPWQKRQITFEEAIGTRRFIYKRVPDEFDSKVFMWLNREM